MTEQQAAKAKAAIMRKPAGDRCKICCARSELANGICADREACEERQPPLIALEDLPSADLSR